MSKNWIFKEDELPNAYEEVEVLLVDGDVRKDMIVQGENGNLEWKNCVDKSIKAWRRVLMVSDLISLLEPYKGFELQTIMHLEVKEEVLSKRDYKFPHDNFQCIIDLDDVSYSDNTVVLGVMPYDEE